MNYLVNEDVELEIKESSISGEIILNPATSEKAKLKMTDKAGFTKIGFNIVAAKSGTCEQGTGFGSISGSSVNKSNNKSCVLDKDESQPIVITGVDPTQQGAACSFNLSVKIKEAGQNKVYGK